MYVVAIAWLYVVLIVSVTDHTIVGGVLTFIFWGLAPLALFLWIFGTPARRRSARRRTGTDETNTNDKAESGLDQ
ncbi:MAG: hypothetical protein KJZ96_17290 [Rhodocyclaceae bacterium]|jgi:biotin transporter BioY|nr:hypothetical protein [Rhodocyclaceae bacterium]MCL4760093.1 hypothetical protein [Rhodocyclaceae bacterium]